MSCVMAQTKTSNTSWCGGTGQDVGSKGMKCEIYKFQEATSLLINKILFTKLSNQRTTQQVIKVKFAASAITALQKPAEAYLVGLVIGTHLCATHNMQIIIIQKVIHLAGCICGEPDLLSVAVTNTLDCSLLIP